ncbi:MAG: hypothetical protein ACW97V_09065, partial [Promethearchaeota archaeon]
MSGREEYNFNDFINNAQKKAKELVLERNQLNSKLKNFILNLQSIDSEIFISLFNAREFYYEKRYEINEKLENLKRKKIEREDLWNRLTKEMSTLPKPKSFQPVSIDSTKHSIEEIENKINIINNTLEEEILEINEENEIIENLRELEDKRQKEINRLVELEKQQVKKLQNNDYYKTQRRIKTFQKELEEIYENLINLSYERLMTHT